MKVRTLVSKRVQGLRIILGRVLGELDETVFDKESNRLKHLIGNIRSLIIINESVLKELDS